MKANKLKGADELLLDVDGVSKHYPIKQAKKEDVAYIRALDNVSFSLAPGLFGLLGPNGAGKSTLINILTNGIYPTRGKVLLNKRSIIKLGASYRGILGYMPQQQNLYSGFSGHRFLVYIASLKEIPSRDIAQEIERVVEITNLKEHLHKKLSSYSGGMKQRLLAATAMMGNPRILIFDEPTAGLDPKERVNFRNYLKHISGTNIVIVATHVVSDIESVADEILLLKKGRLVAKDTPKNLIEQFACGETIEEVYLNIFGEETYEQAGAF